RLASAVRSGRGHADLGEKWLGITGAGREVTAGGGGALRAWRRGALDYAVSATECDSRLCGGPGSSARGGGGGSFRGRPAPGAAGPRAHRGQGGRRGSAGCHLSRLLYWEVSLVHVKQDPQAL